MKQKTLNLAEVTVSILGNNIKTEKQKQEEEFAKIFKAPTVDEIMEELSHEYTGGRIYYAKVWIGRSSHLYDVFSDGRYCHSGQRGCDHPNWSDIIKDIDSKDIERIKLYDIGGDAFPNISAAVKAVNEAAKKYEQEEQEFYNNPNL